LLVVYTEDVVVTVISAPAALGGALKKMIPRIRRCILIIFFSFIFFIVLPLVDLIKNLVRS